MRDAVSRAFVVYVILYFFLFTSLCPFVFALFCLLGSKPFFVLYLFVFLLFVLE